MMHRYMLSLVFFLLNTNFVFRVLVDGIGLLGWTISHFVNYDYPKVRFGLAVFSAVTSTGASPNLSSSLK
jgi:hypothetical protein